MVMTIPYMQSTRRIPWRVLIAITSVTAIHLALFLLAERFLVGRMLGRAFGIGVPITPWERVVAGFDTLASLPLIKPLMWLHAPDPGDAAPLLFPANSLCWGLAAGFAIKKWGSS